MVELVAEWGDAPIFCGSIRRFILDRVCRNFGDHARAFCRNGCAHGVLDRSVLPYSFQLHRARQRYFCAARIRDQFGKTNRLSYSAVVAVSDYATNFLKEQFPKSAAKIHRIYNGLDLSRFKRADFASAVPRMVSIGRLIDKKGFADLIRACDLLKKRGHDFHCEIIGEGPSGGRAAQADRGARSKIAGDFGWPKNSNANCSTARGSFDARIAECGRSRWREGQLADGDHGSDGGGTSGCFDYGWRNSGDGRARCDRDF